MGAKVYKNLALPPPKVECTGCNNLIWVVAVAKCIKQFARNVCKFVYNLRIKMYTVFAKLISCVKCYV